MKENKFFTFTGFISAIISIFDFLYRFYISSKIKISWITITGIICIFLSIVGIIVQRNTILKYTIKKHILYFIKSGDSYWVKNKECIYIFKSRILMEYRKNHLIVSWINNLSSFCDKFKWSKHQELKDIQIKCISPHKTIDIKREENWHCYDITFEEIVKNHEKDINIIIENLKDDNKESLLFLSSNIVNRTQNLKMIVKFEDQSLIPKNIRYQIYDNAASNFPIYEEKFDNKSRRLTYNIDTNIIEVEEYKPIFGYRYVIKWDFK